MKLHKLTRTHTHTHAHTPAKASCQYKELILLWNQGARR